MMIKMTDEQMKKKLKREQTEICLNCKLFSECENIGKFEKCGNFDEVEGEVWTIKKI